MHIFRFSYLLLLVFSLQVNAQQTSNATIHQLNNYHKNFPLEKAYLTFDKNYYNAGDTIWFKCFLINSKKETPVSNKLYIELYNDSLKLVERKAIFLQYGLGFGEFSLPKSLSHGTYTIRAYTNWQKNFGENVFFQKSFEVGNTGTNDWLVNTSYQVATQETTNNLTLVAKLTNLQNQAVGLRDVEVVLMNEQKRVMRANLQTNLQGMINTSIPLGTQINGKYTFYIFDKKDRNKKAFIPLVLEADSAVDFQFLPEGGYMVNNIYGRVAFKVLDKNGLGKALNGHIVNQKNEIVTSFSTLHKGMGSFYLLPKSGEIYTAIYTLNGLTQKQNLPLAKAQGTTLKISQLNDPDSILVSIRISEDLTGPKSYLLTATTTNELIFSVEINSVKNFYNLKFAKKDFPDGIIHFTLFSSAQKPLNERQILINKNKRANVSMATNRNNYGLRDSVGLEISVTTEDGNPLIGSFALSVTANQQVRQTVNESDIASYYFLESEIKGNIEEPAWYFQNDDPNTIMALDNLLLTQAWVGYQWDEILQPAKLPKYKQEVGNEINGRLTNLFNKPLVNTNVNLLSFGKLPLILDTLTNTEGRFIFDHLPIIDTVKYIIQATKRNGKLSLANITIDEVEPASDPTKVIRSVPLNINPDTVLMAYLKISDQQAKQQEKLTGKNVLKEVVIKGTSRADNEVLFGSKLLNKLDEKELLRTPRKSLLDVLRQQIPGLTTSRFWGSCFGKPTMHSFNGFVVGTKVITSIRLDKISTQYLSAPGDHENLYFAQYALLTNLSAEDITSLAVYEACADFRIEITTRAGKGPWTRAAQGLYVYRPFPFANPKLFYSPKYTAHTSATPDLRSTIFWDANVVTDKDGKAKISFYTADVAGTYTIKLEGTDLMGRYASFKKTIVVGGKTTSK